jgi:hypothetical protein
MDKTMTEIKFRFDMPYEEQMKYYDQELDKVKRYRKMLKDKQEKEASNGSR